MVLFCKYFVIISSFLSRRFRCWPPSRSACVKIEPGFEIAIALRTIELAILVDPESGFAHLTFRVKIITVFFLQISTTKSSKCARNRINYFYQ